MDKLWTRWTLANALGELVGLGGAFVVGMAVTAAVGGAESLAFTLAFAALLIALGTLEGVVVGWAQWWAMAEWLPGLGRGAWVRATALGAFVAWCLGMIPSTLANLGAEAATATVPAISDALIYTMAAGMGLVLGPILGFPQWLVLRRHVERAWWWIVANALAWLAGMPIVFVGASTIPEGATGAGIVLTVLVTLAVAGAVVGAIHGAFLVWLVGGRRRLLTT